MKFILKNNKNETLLIGTKQDCMHFIKRRALNRSETTLKKYEDSPAPHYTVPVTSEVAPPKSFFKKIFG